jgi:hypothetical protein
MKTKSKVKRPPSPKMLRHLRRLHKLIRQRTKDRKAAAEAKKAQARARYAAKKS